MLIAGSGVPNFEVIQQIVARIQKRATKSTGGTQSPQSKLGRKQNIFFRGKTSPLLYPVMLLVLLGVLCDLLFSDSISFMARTPAIIRTSSSYEIAATAETQLAGRRRAHPMRCGRTWACLPAEPATWLWNFFSTESHPYPNQARAQVMIRLPSQDHARHLSERRFGSLFLGDIASDLFEACDVLGAQRHFKSTAGAFELRRSSVGPNHPSSGIIPVPPC